MGEGMFVSDGDEKLHLISCEATCVHEGVAKRIPNVRFTNFISQKGERNYDEAHFFDR